MAKATTHIEKSVPNAAEEQAQGLGQLLQALAENREAILLAMDVLGELHKAGLLEMLQALLKNRHEIGVIGIEQLNKPGAHRILKNGMNLVQFLSAVEPASLQTLLNGVAGGVKKVGEADGGTGTGKAQPQPGMWGMVKLLRDPEVSASVNVLVNFLRGMGHEVRNTTTH
ncbi:MAG TPA: DUF1641 domain-containing protein [Bacilli bacterium]|nr:DUF1641 domain-containing protein [Bacilli bacterium]